MSAAYIPRRRAVLAVLIRWAPYVAVTALGAASAYFQVFTAYFFVDDEGYVMLSLKQFVSGRPLYDDVFSQYGPFLYEAYGAVFKVLGLPFTTNTGRMITWILWVAIALGYGLLAQRISGSRWVGVIAELTAFAVLFFGAREPFHPTGPTTLLVLLLLAVVVLRGAARGAALAAGALIAAAALTKINVGALAAVAIVVAAGLTLPTRHRALWRAGAIGLALVTPIALMASNLDMSIYREFAYLAVMWLGAAAVRLATTALPDDDSAPGAVAYLAWLTCGAAAAAVAICLVIFALGTSADALVHGILLDPLNHPAELVGSPQVLGASLWISGAMLAGVVVFSLGGRYVDGLVRGALRDAYEPNALAIRGAIRIAAAIATVIAIAHVQWVAPPNLAVAFAPVVAWLAVVPAPEIEEDRNRRFIRAAIVLVAIFGLMQAYPAPGAQLLAGLLTFALVAALLASDGLALIALWTPRQRPQLRRAAAPVLLIVAAAATFYLAVNEVGRPGRETLRYYRERDPLPLAGASMVRLPADLAQTLNQTVAAIGANGCQKLVTVPGMNSFYLWSGLRPPTGENMTHWFIVLDAGRQRRVVDALEGPEKVCVLRNDEIIQFWTGASKDDIVPRRPLWRWVQEHRSPDVFVGALGTYGAYRLQVPPRETGAAR